MGQHFTRVQVSIPMDTGLPQDAAVNTFTFCNYNSAADRLVDAGIILSQLDGFYTALASLYSSRCDMNAITVKMTDLLDSKPRVPYYTGIVTAGAGVTIGMDFPAEVALCVSFKGQPLSGHNARRERGRIYLGPLQVDPAYDYNVVLPTTITTVMAAVNTHLAVGGSQIIWSIYSLYEHCNVPVGTKYNHEVHEEDASRLLGALTDVYSYWIDNEFDTQRRRGLKATTRTTALA